MTMAKDDEEDKLPDQDVAKEFYAKYEPKEVLGRWGYNVYLLFCQWRSFVFSGVSALPFAGA